MATSRNVLALMSDKAFPKIGHYKDVDAFAQRVEELKLDLPMDRGSLSAAQGTPMAKPLELGGGISIGNRWCIHPMEGWDGTTDGAPSEHTLRRWKHFGESGAKLIWGGEAFAVQADGRANPNQLGVVGDSSADLDRAARGMDALLDSLTSTHRERFGSTDDLLVGLQLTHSGRFCRPNSKTKLEPRIAYHHPLLDAKFGIDPHDDTVLLSDDQLRRIIENYVRATKLAAKAGFRFIDVKHCHGYLGHELLSAVKRPGAFGGSLENRTRFAREIIEGIRAECPGMLIGVRFSAFDAPPFKPDPEKSSDGKLGRGIPEGYENLIPYVHGFGCDPRNPLEMNLAEPIEFVRILRKMGVRLINVSGGSPYYNPHIQRPAMFPPSDGYQPPEDPLVGVVRQIQAVREIKSKSPADCVFVGTGYTYLQEFLPHVAQAAIRNGWTDLVGIGRLVLSYWDMPADTLAGRPMQIRRICRTFSDCTTAPRNGIISGCFPLDPHYKEAPEHATLRHSKSELRKKLAVLKA